MSNSGSKNIVHFNPKVSELKLILQNFVSLQYGSQKEAAKEPDGLAVLGIFIMVNFYGHLLEHVTTISYS